MVLTPSFALAVMSTIERKTGPFNYRPCSSRAKPVCRTKPSDCKNPVAVAIEVLVKKRCLSENNIHDLNSVHYQRMSRMTVEKLDVRTLDQRRTIQNDQKSSVYWWRDW